jgi:glycosyltransferase involved in cell wall biosynthesis
MDDPSGLKYRRNLARRIMSFRTKKFVAVSKDLYGWLRSTVRVPERKLVFIPNGVDTERFSPGRDSGLRKELGIRTDEFVVGTIGRLDPIKNHAGLIQAVRIANEKGCRVRLVMVGDGPERNNVEQLIRMSGVSAEPLLLGYRPDVERLYRTFDAFVLNSFGEGMSNTLLEAMAAELPIVCTSVGGNLELIEHSQRGMLVEPGDDLSLADAIIGYADSAETRIRHAANARQFILQNFSLDAMVQRYVSLYESVA